MVVGASSGEEKRMSWFTGITLERTERFPYDDMCGEK